MGIDTDTMLRLLRGELPEPEARELRSKIDRDPALSESLNSLLRMEDLLRTNAAESFGPYFSDRVLSRIRSKVTPSRVALYESMRWVFLRLAAASLVTVVGLSLYNAVESRDSELSSTPVEAVFGLPAPDLESLFYLQGI